MKNKFMQRAIELARDGMDAGAGGPFGSVVVKDGEIIAEGYNRVTRIMTRQRMPKSLPFVKPVKNWVLFSSKIARFTPLVNPARCVWVQFTGRDQKWFIMPAAVPMPRPSILMIS